MTERALAKKAPYHRDKNSVADAVIIETYAEPLSSDHTDARFAFVTHNTRDFSLPDGDRRQPHNDLAPLFDGSRSRYSVAIAELIHEIDPDLLSDHQLEFELSQQSRSLTEILDAENLLFRQVWYNRHCNLRAQIDAGMCRVVSEAEYSRKPYKHEIRDTVWAQALAAATRTEDEVGADQLGPWIDFEWGMLNGKLSALRWVLGGDWDILDT